MADPFLGEIRLFGFPRVPDGWFACNGQSVSIAQFETLYAVIGTTYGGDGVNTFNLPDLRGRVPIGQGQGTGLPNYTLGQPGGEENHTLIEAEMPTHSHALMSSTATATDVTPGPTLHLATASAGELYAPIANAGTYSTMAPCVATSGNSIGHNNMMPSVVANYCICLGCARIRIQSQGKTTCQTVRRRNPGFYVSFCGRRLQQRLAAVRRPAPANSGLQCVICTHRYLLRRQWHDQFRLAEPERFGRDRPGARSGIAKLCRRRDRRQFDGDADRRQHGEAHARPATRQQGCDRRYGRSRGGGDHGCDRPELHRLHGATRQSHLGAKRRHTHRAEPAARQHAADPGDRLVYRLCGNLSGFRQLLNDLECAMS